MDKHIDFGFSKDGYAVWFIFDRIWNKIEPFFPDQHDQYIDKLKKDNTYMVRYPITKRMYYKIFKDNIDYENDKEYNKLIKQVLKKIDPYTQLKIIPIKKARSPIK